MWKANFLSMSLISLPVTCNIHFVVSVVEIEQMVWFLLFVTDLSDTLAPINNGLKDIGYLLIYTGFTSSNALLATDLRKRL